MLGERLRHWQRWFQMQVAAALCTSKDPLNKPFRCIIMQRQRTCSTPQWPRKVWQAVLDIAQPELELRGPLQDSAPPLQCEACPADIVIHQQQEDARVCWSLQTTHMLQHKEEMIGNFMARMANSVLCQAYFRRTSNISCLRCRYDQHPHRHSYSKATFMQASSWQTHALACSPCTGDSHMFPGLLRRTARLLTSRVQTIDTGTACHACWPPVSRCGNPTSMAVFKALPHAHA